MIVLSMNTLGQNIKGGVCVTRHALIVSMDLNLSFDTNGKAVIRNLCCYLHPIDNHCAIYEHHRSYK